MRGMWQQKNIYIYGCVFVACMVSNHGMSVCIVSFPMKESGGSAGPGRNLKLENLGILLVYQKRETV